MAIALSKKSDHAAFWKPRNDRHYFSLTDSLDLSFQDGKTILPHQESGVHFLLKYRWAILGDDPGLGKTRTSLVAARAMLKKYPDAHLYIYCPSNVKPDWENEIRAIGGLDRLRITIASNSAQAIPDEIPSNRYCLIIDEAHEYKNLSAVRTYKMMPIALDDKCLSNYMLSGTPIKNGSPMDAFPLLRMARHPLGQDWGFFCGAANKNSTEYLARLYKAVQIDYPAMLRRRKWQAMELPEKTRRLYEYQLDTDSQAVYDGIYWALKDEYKRRVREGIISGAGEALSELMRLRRAASWGKSKGTTALAKEYLQEGARGVVIFVTFRESAEAISRELGGVPIIQGGITPAAKRMMIDDFQAGKTPILILTIGSGGVGITLTQGTEAILHDRDWTPALCLQAEDRIHRIGQDSPCRATWMQACAIDEIIDRKILQKQRVIDLIEEGKISDLSSIEDIGNRALQIDAKDVLEELFAEAF
jgi:SNF2 family DNA or RNA helicase